MESFGSWQLEALIAVGGLGEVWRGTRAGEVAAIKRLHTHLVRNEEVRAQFAVEQQLATTLPHHENLTRATEAGDVDGRPYIALTLAPGVELRHLIAPPPTPKHVAPPAVILPRSRVLAVVIAACKAASHLRAHGWVHGDINPGNLMVDDDDRVTLIDLGIAREIGRDGTVRGTHAYMAPEQVRGEAWSSATDVFALGIVLWELIANARLFHRGPPWLSMAAVIEDAVPALADPALDAIARAALDKDPGRRTATADELREALIAL